MKVEENQGEVKRIMESIGRRRGKRLIQINN